MFGALLSPLVDFVGGWFKAKADRKLLRLQTEAAIELKKQEVIASQATAEINWDQTQAANSKSSWKDEWFTILLSIPLIMVFTGFEERVSAGFQALESVPEWYLAYLGAAVAAAFGIRGLSQIRQTPPK